LHAVESWIKGPFVHGQHVVGNALEPLRDSVPVHGTILQAPEDQHFKSPPKEVAAFGGHDFSLDDLKKTRLVGQTKQEPDEDGRCHPGGEREVRKGQDPIPGAGAGPVE
jgi:hypothetical protein